MVYRCRNTMKKVKIRCDSGEHVVSLQLKNMSNEYAGSVSKIRFLIKEGEEKIFEVPYGAKYKIISSCQNSVINTANVFLHIRKSVLFVNDGKKSKTSQKRSMTYYGAVKYSKSKYADSILFDTEITLKQCYEEYKLRKTFSGRKATVFIAGAIACAAVVRKNRVH